jgi:MFS transporter, PPP family, 3-phenylpropionic acid transporter
MKQPAGRAGLFYFAFGIVIAMYGPFLTVYFAQQGLNGREIGILAALAPLFTLLFAPGVTALADRRGWRIGLLSVGLAGMGLALLLTPLATGFTGLLLPMTGLAVAGCAVLPLADSLIARMATRYRLDYGQLRFWCSLSYAGVAVAGGALWQQVGYTPMLVGAGVACLALIGAGLLLEEDPPAPRHERRSARALLRDRRLVAVLVATFANGVAMGMVMTFTGPYIQRLGGGQFVIGLFGGIAAFSELPAMRWGGALMTRLGGPRTLLLAYGLFAAAFLAFALAGDPTWMLAGGFVQGLGYGLWQPVTVRVVDGWVPTEWSATAQGVLNAAGAGLAALIAGPLGGLIYDTAGPVTLFVVSAAASVAAGGALMLILATGRRPRPAPETGAASPPHEGPAAAPPA